MRDLAFFCAARQAREATASGQRLAADLSRRIAALTLPQAGKAKPAEKATPPHPGVAPCSAA